MFDVGGRAVEAMGEHTIPFNTVRRTLVAAAVRGCHTFAYRHSLTVIG